MWRNAKTPEQKMMIINRMLPMTKDMYNEALIYFTSDENDKVRGSAISIIELTSEEDIVKHIPEEFPETGVEALYKIAIQNRFYLLLAKLLNRFTVKKIWVTNIFFVNNQDLWSLLSENKNFIRTAYHLQEEIEEFLKASELIYIEKIKEQFTYLTEIEKIDRDELAEEELDEDEDIVEFDFPDFLITENPFEGLKPEEVAHKRETFAQMLKNLSVAGKIKLAGLGNLEARKALIKDPKRLVYMAVMKNPRITEKEIIAIASDNSMPDDIINLIANKKEYVKNYQVKKSLVLNPKTPFRISVRLMQLLRKEDLKKVSESRSIPASVRSMALRILNKEREKAKSKK